MDSVEVIIIKTLVCCHDGFTESRYEVGSKQSFEKDFAKKQIEAGMCEAFKVRETKPAFIKKEVKAKVTKPKVKREKQSKLSTSD